MVHEVYYMPTYNWGAGGPRIRLPRTVTYVVVMPTAGRPLTGPSPKARNTSCKVPVVQRKWVVTDH